MTSALAWEVVEKAVLDKNPTDLLVGADAVQETEGEDLARTLRWLLKWSNWPNKASRKAKKGWSTSLPCPLFSVRSGRNYRHQRTKYEATLKALVQYATDYRKQGEAFFAI